MQDIKEIIAKNLIDLRKKLGLTQSEFAERLNYSDNTVSRWERGEITPSVETLQQISETYDVPIELLIKENLIETTKEEDKSSRRKHLSTQLLAIAFIWFCAVVAYFYAFTIFHKNEWVLFVLAVPLSCVSLLFFGRHLKNRIFSFVVRTVLLWSALATVYLYLLQYNMFLIFVIGVPPQVALCIWTFVRPKKKKN